MATPTTFEEYYEQVMLSDQEPGKKEFKTIFRKALTQISLLEEQIGKLTGIVNRTEGERDESRIARKDALDAVARVAISAKSSVSLPRRALLGPKKPCATVLRGEVCPYGDKCHFSHTVTQSQ